MKTELDIYIRARYPLLWVVTPEERRALVELEALAQAQRKRLLLWSATVGLVNPAVPDRVDAAKRDPLLLLKTIIDQATESTLGGAGESCLWVLRDFHPFLKDATIVRRLREAAFALEASNQTIVLLGPVLKIPRELEKEITVVDFELPTVEEMRGQLDGIVRSLERSGQIEVALDKRQRARLVQACMGLTATEASNAVAKAVVQLGGRLDGDAIEAVTAEKQQIIRKSGLLEFYASDARLGSVGGLATLKEWLRKRVRAFSDEARAFGLPEPKGILLVGVQGCGKSLVAKVGGEFVAATAAAAGRGAALFVAGGVERGEFAQRDSHGGEHCAGGAVGGRNREGLFGRRLQQRQRRGHGGAGLWLVYHVAAGEAVARLCDCHGQLRRAAAAGAGAQGPLRRDFLC